MKVAVTCKHLQRDVADYRDRIGTADVELVLPPIPGQQLEGDALVAAMEGVTGVIAGDDLFTADVLDRCAGLRAISKWGIGLDGIDLDAAEALSITVTNTPQMFGNEVAELALAYLLNLVRNVAFIDRSVRSGDWPNPVGRSLSALEVAVIGLGDIGSNLAKKLLGLGVTVRGFDPTPTAEAWAAENRIGPYSLGEACDGADAIIVTCPLNDSTHGMIDAETIGLLARGGWLVNVGRGPVVVGDAVLDALETGRLGGAALDVYEVEPLEDERIRSHPQILLGSHNASNTFEACHRTHDASITNLFRSLGLT